MSVLSGRRLLIILIFEGMSPRARMALTCIKRFPAAVGAVLLALGSAMAQPPAATDTDVLAAKEAIQKGNWKALEALRPRFAGHLLEAYPTYWLLSGTVDRADPRDVKAFLD